MSKIIRTGKLAREVCQKSLPLEILKSQAGFYIGTFDKEGPCSRESQEYYRTEALAQAALDANKFTQKEMEIPLGLHPQGHQINTFDDEKPSAKKPSVRPR